eukprot:TRINITY_DN6535_c0_g1_i13.p1 TRINITY_DN6535_c0_g1~~TRINITY_DN6535_c0_g1_i13.p1  ORF type:complete len:309 (-),score=15.15 TRINITY_DN6535_c0_g1_i13:756-1682(-)
MEKAKDLEKLYNWESLSNFKKIPLSKASKKLEKQVDENKSTVLISGIGFRYTGAKQEMIDDLYKILNPLTSATKAHCGFIESVDALAIRTAFHYQRRSQRKCQIDIMIVKSQPGQSHQSFSTETSSLKQTEIFQHFINDLGSLLKQRGLKLLDSSEIRKDKGLNIWLSNMPFSSCFDSLIGQINVNGEISIESIIKNDQQTRTWYNSVMKVLSRFKVPHHRILPKKQFETRGNWSKQLNLCRTAGQKFEWKVRDCFVRQILNSRTALLKYSLTVNNRSRKLLPEEWPLVEFDITKQDLEYTLFSLLTS